MTSGEKLRAALKEADMTEFQLARRMWVSPAYIIALMRGKTEMDGPTRATIERILGLERGALEEDKENAGPKNDADADTGADAGAGADGGGGNAQAHG